MNANVSESGSLTGKMAAIFVVVLFVFSSFSLLASADSGDEQESELPVGITLGEALEPSDEGVEVISEINAIYPGQEIPVTTTMDTGKFSPARASPGDAKILVVDDDGENWMSGPWIEASHVATALNDGGYSYDVFRAGRWGGTNLEIPSGDDGLGILDDYEAIIWYSGWNTNIMESSETTVLSRYLDFECGTVDGTCSDNRNIIVLTQMSDWFDARAGQFQNEYMHSDTYYSSYIVVGGTSNPMKGVEDSIFEGKEYSTDTAGVHYLDRPCGNKAFDDSAIGAFWMDAHKDATHGHEYHAVQYPREGIPGFDYDNEHKAFMFADEIGVFDKRSDRADFMGTILGWMEVTKEAAQNVDMGIGGVDIPNHVQYWRSVEANVELDIRITVTNYGLLPQASTAVHLKLKNEFGQVLFDSTFDTRAFPDWHPMHVADSIQSGDSIVFTFNKTNDYYQRIYDQVDENKARAVIFTSAGMNKMQMQVKHTGDQGLANNYVQADVGVGKWIENGEAPEDEIGPSITFGDTDDNGANSLDHVNYHRATSYDTDGDGCGWAVTTDTNGDGVPDCVDDGYTLNKTENAVFHEGKSSLASFNTNGWYKTGANGADCDWGGSSLSDDDCPKFTPEPNQDDYFVSPPLDLSAMDEVVVGMLFSGCMESGDYFRMQISKDEGSTWTNLINYSGFCPGEGSWYLWGGGNPKYQGYVLGSDYFGKEDTDKILFRVQQDSDNDQNTEGSRPYMGWFIDEIVFRGTERITRDVAIGDITADEDFIVKNQGGNSLWREINATVINAGESPWTDLPVKMSITNLQGDDLTGDLDESDFALPTLAGSSTYGDVRQGQENEDQTDLFALFRCPTANTYYITAEVIVPGARDFFPWNNSMTVMFRVFDTFFKDTVDTSGTGNDGLQRSDVYTYTTVQRSSSGDNTWRVRDIDNNAYDGSEYVWQYAKETGYSKDNPTTVAGGDDSLITQDTYDRDGASGTKFEPDVNVDLRAAFKPILSFAIKWDLGAGDKLEVRAASDFDSSTKLTSGTWSVIKTYTGNCGCVFMAAEDDTWIVEELDLTEFEGYQTWIDFRVVTSTGGGDGVLLDNIMVVGNEYRNNLDIIDVTTERFSASGSVHDLSVTVKGIGLVDQNLVTVTAKIVDANTGITVWPESASSLLYQIPVALAKGDEYTVSPNLPDGAGNAWRWGAGLEPGIYRLEVEAWRTNEQDVNDENPANNIKKYTIVLGAALLSGASENWNLGNGWSEGSYIWDGTDDGSLTSDSFTIWNKKPFLVVEAEYHLTEATVRAEVSVGSSGAWHPVKWRAADQSATLYSIPKQNYTALPDEWTGSSFFDNSTAQTFYADLGAVDALGDGSGNLQDQFIGGTMQVRIVASTTCSGAGCSGGTFTAFYPAVFGLHDYAVDVKAVTPGTQNAIPSSLTGGMVTKTYTVKSNNFGAASDVPIVDFVISAPQDSKVVLDDGTEAVLDSILQQGGGSTSTVVAIKPGTLCWGVLENGVCVGERDSSDGGDNTAYVAQDGTITWPSGDTSSNAAPGWIINNPTKASWDNVAGKPTGQGLTMSAPGDVSTTDIILQVGYASWAPPGTYSIQADARSLADYDNTFTSGDPEGQASMKIAKPDLSIGDNVRYISHATGFGESGSGWVKQTGCENNPTPQEPCVTDPYFSFMFEIVNSGTETVGTFKVGLEDFEGNPLGVQVGVYWSGNGWKIDESMSNAHDAQIIDKKFVSFKATSADLGMSAGPGGEVSGAYTFYLSVDVTGVVSESNENNNKVPITITAVKEVNTVPSFNMSLAAMTVSGLLAAVGIALRQKEEEE